MSAAAVEDFMRKVSAFMKVELEPLLAAEYERGRKEAIQRMVSAAEELHESPPAPVKLLKVGGGLQRHPRAQANGAVPRGLPDLFVRRVLTDHPEGIAPRGISSAGKTPTERSISYSGIRKALQRGRDRGEYLNRGGKWFVAK